MTPLRIPFQLINRSWGLGFGLVVGCLALSVSSVASAEVQAESGALPAITRDAQRGWLRVLVLDSDDNPWYARVRGQLSDLPARVLWAPAEATSETADSRQIATQLARRYEADLVVWLSSVNAGPQQVLGSAHGNPDVVNIWIASKANLYQRAVPASVHMGENQAALHSAVLEVGALSVRSAVRAELDERARTPALSPMPILVAPAGSEPAAAPVSRFRFLFGLHARYLAFAGISPGDMAFGLDVGLQRGPFWLSLGAEASLPSQLRLESAELRLTRQAVLLNAGWDWISEGPFAFGPWLRLGVDRVARVTRVAEPQSTTALLPSASQSSFAAVVGGGLLGGWEFSGTQRLLLWIGANLEFPRREYVILQAASSEVQLLRTWLVQPNLGLSWELRL